MFVQDIFGNVLSEDVRHIFCSQDLVDAEVACSDSVLDPQIGCGKVPDSAQATPSANAHRGSGVRAKRDSPCEANIRGD